MNGLKQQLARFKDIESNLHRDAKANLVNWLKQYPDRFGIEDWVSIRIEEAFCENGIVLFKPDITVYNKDGLKYVYEIHHTSPLTGAKLSKMQCFFFEYEMNPVIFEISAYYIQKQIECPLNIKMFRFEMFDDGQLF